MNIKELDERIKQLKDLVASANDTIKLAEEMVGLAEKEMDKLADQKKGEPKFERMERGKQYHYLYTCSQGVCIERTPDIYNMVDTGYFNTNNYFHTEERAQEVVDKINLLLKLERLHDIYCPNYVPDWNDKDKVKYYVFKNEFISISKWDIGYVSTSDISDVYFPTEEIAKKVCDILNAELREKEGNCNE